jgi:hypothetical protein
MHSALVVIQIPENDQKWLAVMASVENLQETQKGVARLAENVWLVNFQENPTALGRLIFSADQHRVRYGILQLADAPQWLPDDFDPKTS